MYTKEEEPRNGDVLEGQEIVTVKKPTRSEI